LQDRWAGWESRDTAKAFADYASYVAEKLSGRIKHFSRSTSSPPSWSWASGGGMVKTLASLMTDRRPRRSANTVFAVTPARNY
jgi:hypothetical protein